LKAVVLVHDVTQLLKRRRDAVGVPGGVKRGLCIAQL
jgi:hypothetical protein